MGVDAFAYYVLQNWNIELHLGLKRRRFLAALLKRCPLPVPYSALLDAVYFDDPEGGPLTAMGVVKLMKHSLQQLFKPTPFIIKTHWNYGYSFELSSEGGG